MTMLVITHGKDMSICSEEIASLLELFPTLPHTKGRKSQRLNKVSPKVAQNLSIPKPKKHSGASMP